MINSYSLGQVEYQSAWRLQHQLVAARSAGTIDNVLLLLEHPHTYTLGSSGKRDHLLMDGAALEAEGVAVYDVDRGGDITYHGPGQLVGYPILQLTVDGAQMKVHVVDYIRQLEAVLITVLKQFGITGERLKGYTGVWVNIDGTLHKVAAIGVKVNARGVTMHGFALNVNPQMRFFKGIIPCGISDKPVTSMQSLLGRDISIAEVEPAVRDAFGGVFEVPVITCSGSDILQFSNNYFV